ncbi:molecular chaperone DnaJ [Erythrobacter sp.]|uniref:molecular chaperone DnaJ n=1 Tax=Erythrobacter sp. TaxID=1042 RepID=UPI0025BC0BE9|nr:molecular chaperone DnaJ [Erythrobacter sp.]
MLKAAIILLLIVIVWRWALGSWPWDGLFAQPGRERELAQARLLLGVGKRAGRGQILAAHKRVLARVHPDRGGSSAAVHEANAARDLLLAELSDGGASGANGDPGAGGDGGGGD